MPLLGNFSIVSHLGKTWVSEYNIIKHMIRVNSKNNKQEAVVWKEALLKNFFGEAEEKIFL